MQRARAKSSPPHQDGALGFTLGYSRHIDPAVIPSDVPFSSTSFGYPNELDQAWSGPLVQSSKIGAQRQKHLGGDAKEQQSSVKGKKAAWTLHHVSSWIMQQNRSTAYILRSATSPEYIGRSCLVCVLQQGHTWFWWEMGHPNASLSSIESPWFLSSIRNSKVFPFLLVLVRSSFAECFCTQVHK